MDSIFISKEDVCEYIKNSLKDSFVDVQRIKDAKYHHNTSYSYISSVIKNGILPIKDLNNLNIRNFNLDTLKVLDDITSHPNGINGISLSVLGLEDIYPGEYEYNPLNMKSVDILVTDNIKTSRNSTNYGNEFICYNPIEPTKFRSIDVRILKFLNYCNSHYGDTNIEQLIYMYNSLQMIAASLNDMQLSIPLREMSYENNQCLNTDKISKSKKIVLLK